MQTHDRDVDADRCDCRLTACANWSCAAASAFRMRGSARQHCRAGFGKIVSIAKSIPKPDLTSMAALAFVLGNPKCGRPTSALDRVEMSQNCIHCDARRSVKVTGLSGLTKPPPVPDMLQPSICPLHTRPAACTAANVVPRIITWQREATARSRSALWCDPTRRTPSRRLT